MERAGVDVDHRRRDAARELLEPLRDRARRRRPRRAGRRARPHRPREPGAARRRADPPHAAVEVRDVEFLRSITDRRIKITVPGPFTMTQQAQNDHYADDRELALAYAEAVNEELRDLKAAGADVVQIDEPYLQARPEAAREYALEAIDRALDGIDGETVLHTCFGYARDRPRPAERLSVPRASSNDCARRTSRSRRRSRISIREVLRDAAGQDDRPRRARPRLARGRDRRSSSPNASAGRSRSCRRSGSSSRPTAA